MYEPIATALKIARGMLRARPEASLDQITELMSDYGQLTANTEQREVSHKPAPSAGKKPARSAKAKPAN